MSNLEGAAYGRNWFNQIVDMDGCSRTKIENVSVEVNLRRCCVAGCSTEVAEKLGGPLKGDFLEHWNIVVENLKKEFDEYCRGREIMNPNDVVKLRSNGARV